MYVYTSLKIWHKNLCHNKVDSFVKYSPVRGSSDIKGNNDEKNLILTTFHRMSELPEVGWKCVFSFPLKLK